ncbi:PTS system, sucrose-specific IIB component [Spiroplasma chinense]|uniref:PTS system, sucrose-specific IIB component n=1 Tax=Spiroplasma chinense TaxID=216932 RepID=A0A5B9Y5Z8_9MOLU|nr:PTS transporter subunit EIIC [Spiroplasma chinense]QEH61462.1 PTS system, sucrose-specific IIB component [Spiroplasma chinense]
MSKKIDILSPCDGEIIKTSHKNTINILCKSNKIYNFLGECEIKNIDRANLKIEFLVLNKYSIFLKIKGENLDINWSDIEGKIKEKSELFSKNSNEDVLLEIYSKNDRLVFDEIDERKVLVGDLLSKVSINEEFNIDELMSYSSKWDNVAKSIYEFVGSNTNYSKFYNCVTRFRVVVKDKNLVKQEEIKKIKEVKGLKWNGDELQIIIGGDVYKLADAFDKFVGEKKVIKNTTNVKRTFKDRLLASVTGVIIPALPVIMAAGILKAIQAILVQTGLIAEVVFDASHPSIVSYDLLTCLVYIIAEAGLSFMGIYFCYNTVKYLGGNEIMGIFIGLALVCPFFYSEGSWLSFKLFTLGNVDVAVKGYPSSIIPQIFAGLIYFYVDRSIRKWIPSSIDIVLRPAITFLITMILSFMVVGPVMGIVESGINYVLSFINKVPFGIGVGIFTLLWQPIVLTGMHYPLILPIMLDQAQNDTTTTILVGTTIGVLGQAGAALAVVVRTKSAQTKSIGIGSLPAAFFGVTEPAIYGVTLPKFWPFVYGCVGAGIAGFISGLLNVVSYSGATPSMGLIFVVGFIRGGTRNILFGIMVLLLAAIFSFVLVFITYRDRTPETKQIKQTSKVLANIYKLKMGSKISESTYNNDMVKINKFVNKERDALIQQVDQNLSKVEKFTVAIENIKNKELLKKEELIMKMKYWSKKNNTKRLEYLKEKFDLINNDEKLKLMDEKKSAYILNNEKPLMELKVLQESFLKETNEFLRRVSNDIDVPEILNLEFNYFNAIHSVDISYGITEKNNDFFIRQDFKKLKTNNKLIINV